MNVHEGIQASPGMAERSKDSILKTPLSRRRVIKAGIGAGLGVGVGRGRTEAAKKADIPFQEEPAFQEFLNGLSPEAAEWMALPFEAQAAAIRDQLAYINEIDSKVLQKVGGPLQPTFDPEMFAGCQPPIFAKNDVIKAQRREEPYFFLGRRNDPSVNPQGLQLVTDLNPGDSIPTRMFAAVFSGLFSGVTNHPFKSRDGKIILQVGHWAGYSNEGKEGRWNKAGYLGHISLTDKIKTSAQRQLKEAKIEGDTQWPFIKPGEREFYPYEHVLNRLLGTRGRAVYYGAEGVNLDMSTVTVGSGQTAPELEENLAVFSETHKKHYYAWRWQALHAAAMSPNNEWVLWSFDQAGGLNSVEITDWYPDIKDPETAPEVLGSNYFLYSKRKELTINQVLRIPWMLPMMLAESDNSIFDGRVVPQEAPDSASKSSTS